MNKFLLHSAKVLSVGLLLSIASTKGMLNDNDIDLLSADTHYSLIPNRVNNGNIVENSEKNAVQAPQAAAPVKQESVVTEIKETEVITTPTSGTPAPEVVKTTITETKTVTEVFANDNKLVPASGEAPKVVEITETKIQTPVVNGATKVVAVKDTLHGARTKIVPMPETKEEVKASRLAGIKAWFGKQYNFAVTQKAEAIDYLKKLHARGWKNWTVKERVAVVAITAAVTGLVVYGSYKAYKALTKEEDKKGRKKTVRRVVRA